MKKQKIFCSLIEIEREYYPEAFLERRKRLKDEIMEETEFDLAQIVIEDVKDELEKLVGTY